MPISSKRPIETLSIAEVERLLDACSRKAPTGIRNRALIVLLWRAGLRINEALALRVKDINSEQGMIRVLHGKGDKARTVGLDPRAFALLELWLQERRKCKLSSRVPLFCTLQGKPLQDRYVRALLSRLAAKAEIDKRVHPHGLRHTHASELAAEGIPINQIQKQLGHTSLATTSRYLDHIAPQDLINTMRQRQW